MDKIIKYNSASRDTIKLHLPLDSAPDPPSRFPSTREAVINFIISDIFRKFART